MLALHRFEHCAVPRCVHAPRHGAIVYGTVELIVHKAGMCMLANDNPKWYWVLDVLGALTTGDGCDTQEYRPWTV